MEPGDGLWVATAGAGLVCAVLAVAILVRVGWQGRARPERSAPPQAFDWAQLRALLDAIAAAPRLSRADRAILGREPSPALGEASIAPLTMLSLDAGTREARLLAWWYLQRSLEARPDLRLRLLGDPPQGLVAPLLHSVAAGRAWSAADDPGTARAGRDLIDRALNAADGLTDDLVRACARLLASRSWPIEASLARRLVHNAEACAALSLLDALDGTGLEQGLRAYRAASPGLREQIRARLRRHAVGGLIPDGSGDDLECLAVTLPPDAGRRLSRSLSSDDSGVRLAAVRAVRVAVSGAEALEPDAPLMRSLQHLLQTETSSDIVLGVARTLAFCASGDVPASLTGYLATAPAGHHEHLLDAIVLATRLRDVREGPARDRVGPAPA